MAQSVTFKSDVPNIGNVEISLTRSGTDQVIAVVKQPNSTATYMLSDVKVTGNVLTCKDGMFSIEGDLGASDFRLKVSGGIFGIGDSDTDYVIGTPDAKAVKAFMAKLPKG